MLGIERMLSLFSVFWSLEGKLYRGTYICWYHSTIKKNTTYMSGQKAPVFSHQFQKPLPETLRLVNMHFGALQSANSEGPPGLSSMKLIMIQNVMGGTIRKPCTLTMEFDLNGY